MNPTTKAETTENNTNPGNDLAQPGPAEPYSIFDKRQKAIIVVIISVAATFSGFASNAYFPALPSIAEDLSVSVRLVNLTVTTYLIFQGLAPSLWGPISDVKGRRVAYIFTFIVFLGACIGLAQTRNYTTLIVLRCLQSTGSASTIAIGSGVIGDVTIRAERGGYMGVFQAGLLVPVAIGPVIGGAIAGSLGWRAIFWFIVIYCGIFLLCLVLFLPETLRSRVGNGNKLPKDLVSRHPLRLYQKTTKLTCDVNAQSSLPPKKHVDLLGPLRILISKQAFAIISFLAVQFAVWQMSITALSTLFESRYGLSETQIGLTFIANGVGSIIGTFTTGMILNADYRRVQRTFAAKSQTEISLATTDSNDHFFPLERARLRLMPIFSLVQGVSILVFGWTVQYPHQVPLAIPIVSTFVTGWTAVSMQSAITTYLVDVFPDRGAAAGASLNLARCLMAAGGTSIIDPMIDAMGVGWAYTLCAAVQTMALVGVVVQWKFGGKWRVEAESADRANT